MSRLLLHIGFDKTGTTSIQRFLFEHRRPLSRRGLIYAPPTQPNYPYEAINHELLTSLLLPPDLIPPFAKAAFGSAEAAKSAALRWLKSVRDLRSRRWRELVVSSEAFYSLPPSAVRELCDIGRFITGTQNFEEGVTVLAYVAEPLQRFRRSASQLLVTGRKISRPSDQTARRYIERFIESFGAANVRVRPYDRTRLLNGNVVDDFLEQISPGLAEDRDLVTGGWEENRSLSAEALLLCNVLRELGLLGETQNGPIRSEIVLFDRVIPGGRTAALAAEVASLLQDSSPDYDWLESEFGCAFGHVGPRRAMPPFREGQQLSMDDIFRIDPERYAELAAYTARSSLVLERAGIGVQDLLRPALLAAPCTRD